MLLKLDGFKQYTNGADLLKTWSCLASSNASLVPAGPFGDYGAYMSTSAMYHNSMHHLLLDTAEEDICISCDFKLTNASGVMIFGVSPASYRTISSPSRPPAVAISFEMSGVNAYIYHSIVTNAGATTLAMNKLMLHQFPALLVGESYTLEMRVSKAGTVTAILNGERVDLTFDPARVAPLSGYELTEFDALTCYATNLRPIANVVIYRDDAETAFPIGPISIEYLLTSNPNLGVGPANDATDVRVGGSSSFDLADPVGTIFGGMAFVRAGAAEGNIPVHVIVDVELDGVKTNVVDHDIAPSMTPDLYSAVLPIGHIAAGTRFTIQTSEAD